MLQKTITASLLLAGVVTAQSPVPSTLPFQGQLDLQGERTGQNLREEQKDDTLSEAQRAAQCETYATQAVAHLRKMCEIGDDDAVWIAKRGLDPIRDRADFKQLEAEFKGR